MKSADQKRVSEARAKLTYWDTKGRNKDAFIAKPDFVTITEVTGYLLSKDNVSDQQLLQLLDEGAKNGKQAKSIAWFDSIILKAVKKKFGKEYVLSEGKDPRGRCIKNDPLVRKFVEVTYEGCLNSYLYK